MDSLDPGIVTCLAVRFLYNIGIGLAGISIAVFALVAIIRTHAFIKWRNYVDAGRPR